MNTSSSLSDSASKTTSSRSLYKKSSFILKSSLTDFDSAVSVVVQPQLTFKLKTTNHSSLLDYFSATVTLPSGSSESGRVVKEENECIAVTFVPKESGVHSLAVKYKSLHIPGSPFKFHASPLLMTEETEKPIIRATGSGLTRGFVDESLEFDVVFNHDVEGSLGLSIEGPSKAVILFKDDQDNHKSVRVSYRVSQSGVYRISVKFNDTHIADSPFKVTIEDRKPLTADTSYLFKKKAVQELTTKSVDSLDQSKRIFSSSSSTAVELKSNETTTEGITATGVSSTVFSGVKSDFVIRHGSLNHGSLCVTIDGPSKVTMDCVLEDHDDSYRVSYTPMTPGDYFIAVKFNATHIRGSPFRVKCIPKAVPLITSSSMMTSSTSTSNNKTTSTTILQKQEQLMSSSSLLTPKTTSLLGPSSSSSSGLHRSSQTAGGSQVMSKNKQNEDNDASKVTASGVGLSRAFVGKQNSFTVNCSHAGKFLKDIPC